MTVAAICLTNGLPFRGLQQPQVLQEMHQSGFEGKYDARFPLDSCVLLGGFNGQNKTLKKQVQTEFLLLLPSQHRPKKLS